MKIAKLISSMTTRLFYFLGFLLSLFVCKELLFKEEDVGLMSPSDIKPKMEQLRPNNWPLLPTQDSILNIDDEIGFQKALRLAQEGNMEAMLGLISWFNRKDDVVGARQWIDQLDAVRASKGLKPFIDSLPKPPSLQK